MKLQAELRRPVARAKQSSIVVQLGLTTIEIHSQTRLLRFLCVHESLEVVQAKQGAPPDLLSLERADPHRLIDRGAP